jgi:hypothetical protein
MYAYISLTDLRALLQFSTILAPLLCFVALGTWLVACIL